MYRIVPRLDAGGSVHRDIERHIDKSIYDPAKRRLSATIFNSPVMYCEAMGTR